MNEEDLYEEVPDVNQLIAKMEEYLTPQLKDWVKIGRHADRLGDLPILVPTLEIEFLAGEAAFFEAIDATVAGAAPGPG